MNEFFLQVTDGERLPLAVKELGSCDLYPQVTDCSSKFLFEISSSKDMFAQNIYQVNAYRLALCALQSLKHNPNGRFVVVCGDGEYIIYTALAWRNRSFGSALDFAWSTDGEYAVRESTSKIKTFGKNFQVKTT